jgi:lipoprotein signal peptidase
MSAPGRRKVVVCLTVVPLLLLCDRVAKSLSLAHLDARMPWEALSVWRGHLYLFAERNSAGPFGLLSGLPPAARSAFFLAATLVFVVFLITLVVRLEPARERQTWPLALMIGGVLGNGWDRLVYGAVIDCAVLIVSRQGLRVWFNLADVAILCGLVWIVAMHLERRGDVAVAQARS